MATGAFAAYKLATAFPELEHPDGDIDVGWHHRRGRPSVRHSRPLRIKGFYLAVATLASQFFLIWMFNKFGWFTNYSSSGVISAPPMSLFGDNFVTGPYATPEAKYLFTLTLVVLFALMTKIWCGPISGANGWRYATWILPAEIIGIKCFRPSSKAFGYSSFCAASPGHSGRLSTPVPWSRWRSTSIALFQILFMIIIGGLGSIMGAFWCRLYRAVAHFFLQCTPLVRPEYRRGHDLTHRVHGVRRADHLFLIVEHAWTCPLVAAAQRKTAALALPLLNSVRPETAGTSLAHDVPTFSKMTSL